MAEYLIKGKKKNHMKQLPTKGLKKEKNAYRNHSQQSVEGSAMKASEMNDDWSHERPNDARTKSPAAQRPCLLRCAAHVSTVWAQQMRAQIPAIPANP